MDPTEDEITAKQAEALGQISRDQAKQLLINQASHNEALNPTEEVEVEEEQTATDGTVTKVKVKKTVAKKSKKAAR